MNTTSGTARPVRRPPHQGQRPRPPPGPGRCGPYPTEKSGDCHSMTFDSRSILSSRSIGNTSSARPERVDGGQQRAEQRPAQSGSHGVAAALAVEPAARGEQRRWPPAPSGNDPWALTHTHMIGTSQRGSSGPRRAHQHDGQSSEAEQQRALGPAPDAADQHEAGDDQPHRPGTGRPGEAPHQQRHDGRRTQQHADEQDADAAEPARRPAVDERRQPALHHPRLAGAVNEYGSSCGMRRCRGSAARWPGG